MTRRTKIVCTLGPASSDQETIRRMIAAGMDVARLNFSHGSHETHRKLIFYVRDAAEKVGRVVPILQDLQGPKIRIGDVRGGGVLIHKGQRLVLSTEPVEMGDRERVYIDYPTITQDVESGRSILLDDGSLELCIIEVREKEIVTEVMVGGPMRSRKGVNLPHIRTNTPSLTGKDIEDLEFGFEMDVEMIALSFVRTDEDVAALCRRVHDSGKTISVVAKIEKPEAVDNVEEILDVADAIMVARGDLGIEMPMQKVPGAQKRIIRSCLAAARPVITATQMLESMIENPRPTRAEATDVANAVLDGSDALMLSGETATGKHPVRVVEMMDQIIREAERYREQYHQSVPVVPREGFRKHDVTDAVSYTSWQLAEQIGAAALVCLTASGATARAIARHRPTMPVYAFTDNPRVVGQLGVLWGTKAFAIPFQRDTDQGINLVHNMLGERGVVHPGDLIVITAGMPLPSKGGTNMIHVSRM